VEGESRDIRGADIALQNLPPSNDPHTGKIGHFRWPGACTATAMSIGSFIDHLFHPAAQGAAQAASRPAEKPDDSDFSFDDLVDIVNPLQHIPVVGTLYRAITHDTIKTPEKIAGDTLYGGMWGFVSALADTAFQRVTGKNFGDTVLALFTGGDAKPAAVADAMPPKSSTETPMPDVAALSASLSRAGADGELAQRALYAYRRATSLVAPPVLAPY
jgi:hypothetical protein